jgi:hypothetical protein
MKMNRIKEALQEKGLTQVWLAEQVGKSFNSDCIVGYFINPTRKQIAVDATDKIKEELQSTLKVDF